MKAGTISRGIRTVPKKGAGFIDIAGLSIRIEGDAGDLPLVEVSSRTSARHVVEFVDMRKEPVRESCLRDKNGEWFIALKKEGHCVSVLGGKKKEVDIGRFDLSSGKGYFNYYSDALKEALFPPFLRVLFQMFTIFSGGFCVHSSGVVWKKKGYLFSGPSGSGKTTVASLAPKGARTLSDEYIAVKPHKGKFRMYSTPWRLVTEGMGELEGIFFLAKSKKIMFERLSRARAIMMLLPNVLYNLDDKELMSRVFRTADDLLSKVPAYMMHFPVDKAVWEKIEIVGADPCLPAEAC
ncbi:MAG: hypothetical protein HQL30_12175 [Candidatus Omnitrophica bacterium]|nr:hypothetical protein [Candidatus Omnitrophota bacterium]